jgi:hypothetical protein
MNCYFYIYLVLFNIILLGTNFLDFTCIKKLI